MQAVIIKFLKRFNHYFNLDFDNGINICEKCDVTCATCNGLGPNLCFTCDSTKNRILSGTTCLCIKFNKIN
jgi:hypothetical protein